MRLGARELPAGEFPPGVISGFSKRTPPPSRRMVGIELVIADESRDVAGLAARLQALTPEGMTLAAILNRAERVWPDGGSPRLHTSQWRCRFIVDEAAAGRNALARLLGRVAEADLDAVRAETLFDYDGAPGYRPALGGAA